jgi:ABC-type branched-subunit amino acid transport system substrate-binding protein
LDPELRAYLDAMRAEMTAMDAKIDATRAVAEAALQVAAQARDGIADARTETRVLHEDTWKKIKALGEGLSTHQRQESGRIADAREQALMERHVLPLEASVANHEKRIKAIEQQR